MPRTRSANLSGTLFASTINVSSITLSSGQDISGTANLAYNQANSAFNAANNRVLKAGDVMTGQLNISTGGLIVTGNIGINKSNPSYALQIGDPGSAANNMLVFGGGQGTAIGLTSAGIFAEYTGVSTGSFLTFMGGQGIKFKDYTNNSEWMRIANSNVAIRSTDTANATLTLFGDSADPFNTPINILKLVTSAGNQGSSARIDMQVGAARPYIEALVTGPNSGSGAALAFATPSATGVGTERMRIASDGNVSIGTTSASSKLHVNGEVLANGTVNIAPDNGEGYVGSRVVLRTHNNYRGAGIFMVGETSAISNNTFYIGTPYTGHNAGVYIRYTANNYQTDYQSSSYTAAGTTLMSLAPSGAVSIPGSLSKGSGSFKIDHPLPEKSNTHYLVHSFIEGPQADLIYRGRANLVNGVATVNIDTAAGITEGTFVLLCRDVQCFTSNETDWDNVRGYVNGNILTIECQNPASNSVISWMVIGERQDQHMYDTQWTDDNGKVIVEPVKETNQVIE